MRKMKDSGVLWIGEIPTIWDVLKSKYILVSNDGGVWGKDSHDGGSNQIVLRSTEQTMDGKWNIIDPALRDLSGIAYNRYKILPDDLVITKSSGSASHIGKTTLADDYFFSHECYYSNFLQRLRVSCNPKFAWYLFNTQMVREQFVYRQNSTSGIGNLNSVDLESVYIPCPSLPEQQRISSFLDTKCAEIDALTADIQTQIDTLGQYKSSVITEAVTKGLNPDAEMGDSGDEWVGAIPASWLMKKGKYLFAQRNLRGNLIELQLLSPTQKYGVIPQTLYEELSGMNAVKLKENADLASLKTIHKGDYCISLRSFQGGFEYSEYEGVVSPAYQVFYPTIAIADGYYKYLFKESGFIEKMNSYTMTLRDGKNIAFADFGNTYIPYPPISEQQAIADYLDAKCTEIDEIISQKQEQLSVIEGYKKSLIFEYVTGKKEV